MPSAIAVRYLRAASVACEVPRLQISPTAMSSARSASTLAGPDVSARRLATTKATVAAAKPHQRAPPCGIAQA